MAAAMLVVEGDVTDLETDTPRVGLETVLLQVAACATQVANADEGAISDSVTFAFAPDAFVAQTVRRPVPWTVDRFLDAVDVPRREGRCGGGEGRRDVAAEAAVAVGSG